MKIKQGICELLDRWEFLRSANVIFAKKKRQLSLDWRCKIRQ